MKAKELKSILSIEQIMAIMEHLGAEGRQSSNFNEIIYRTICHNGESHKLYFFRDTKLFHCYSNCGQLDIINIVQNVYNINVPQAIDFICKFCGIKSNSEGFLKVGFGSEETIDNDWEVYEMYQEKPKEVDMTREFKHIDPSVLEMFYRMYHPAFYEDGISLETQYKFGIRYDILNQRIIIPHWDEEGNLIAVRCRNLMQHKIDEGMKYMPITVKGKLLSAHTSKYFYGLNFNIDNIKRIKKVILVESEKAVMQLDTILKDNIAVALSSSSLSLIQVQILKDLGVQEVIIGVDKEYEEFGSEQEQIYAMKVRKGIINKLIGNFDVSVLWDRDNLLGLKDSPSDRGAEVFWKLMNNRIKVS